jgi:hypothetical protein
MAINPGQRVRYVIDDARSVLSARASALLGKFNGIVHNIACDALIQIRYEHTKLMFISRFNQFAEKDDVSSHSASS